MLSWDPLCFPGISLLSTHQGTGRLAFFSVQTHSTWPVRTPTEKSKTSPSSDLHPQGIIHNKTKRASSFQPPATQPGRQKQNMASDKKGDRVGSASLLQIHQQHCSQMLKHKSMHIQEDVHQWPTTYTKDIANLRVRFFYTCHMWKQSQGLWI